jgi:hypothetical protein
MITELEYVVPVSPKCPFIILYTGGFWTTTFSMIPWRLQTEPRIPRYGHMSKNTTLVFISFRNSLLLK